jgi:predicted dehydrogenase/threonine dehydrogenase-like Zn-dependent dehydrogenase
MNYVKAVLFWPRHGNVTVEEVPPPRVSDGHLLIRNDFSLISAGTERARMQLGKQGLLNKARQRPDQVKQVLAAVRQQGLVETYRLVSDRLDAASPIGYSSAGVVVGVGSGVDGLAPGMRVAAGGAGYASHADVVCVPKNLCVAVPDSVPSRSAAFATVGAIALQGIHQAGIQPGSRVAVIGLGLVGQLAVRLLAAYGCDVVGIDREPAMLDLARAIGIPALARDDDRLVSRLRTSWAGADADAVLVTAAARSTDPVELAGELARDCAVVVIVGDVTVAPPRDSYYGKELSIRYSRSYGPGRYDPRYEETGVDYPAGYVPWTERRNMAEILRLLDRKLLDIESLSPVEFNVSEAAAAYELLDARGPDRRVAILLSYCHSHDLAAAPPPGPVRLPPPRPHRPATGPVRIAAVGAGSFATRMLFPHLARSGKASFSWITTSSGVSARAQGARWGFGAAVGSLDEGLALGDTDCVMVLTRHDSHARYAAEVLRAGLALYCEKPLAIDEEELEAVAAAWLTGGAPAMVGFNRRFAPLVRELKTLLVTRLPAQITYRVFAGKLPASHWYFNERQGGRTLGEVCHFVDLAGYLIGAAPVRVHAHAVDHRGDTRQAQSISVLVEYADGSTATVMYDGTTPPGAPKELVEVAADGLAARIDDYRSLKVWLGSRRPRVTRYRHAAKGHPEEMRALVELGASDEPCPATDFPLSLWSTLVTLRAVEAAAAERGVPVEPRLPSLRTALALPAIPC